ncbi:unnamed protein product [Sphagnum tenellum]
MAQARVGAKGMGRLSGGKGVVLIELKNRILAALNKLSDRDTQQLAVEDLERLAQGLTPEGLALFLACLYDTDAQQKSVVRRECIKLLGTLATLHQDLLASHLPKMVANIVRRLKDPDSNIRDACVDTIGILASQTGRGIEAGASLNVFVKPFFEALGEQHRNLQVGASLCMARVIDCTTDPDPPTLQLLCPRIAKLLGGSNFMGRAALLTTIASLSQVPGVVTGPVLATMITCVFEELENTEWAARKAAADTLTCMANALGPSLNIFRAPCTTALQNCRFDKVKPVRDSVAEALLSWKKIPDISNLQSLPQPSPAAKGSSYPISSRAQVNASFPVSTTHMKSIPERSGSSLKKRSPALCTKNPDFFRKLENASRNTELRASEDWQVEVATPQGASFSGLSPHQGSSTMGYMNEEGSILTNVAQPPSDAELTSWDASVPVTSPNSSNGSFADAVASSTETTTTPDWTMVYNHLQNIEHQQCSMMGMLQEFMVNVYENMQGLEGRVQRLEQAVDGRAHSASMPVDRLPDVSSPTLGVTSSHSLGELLAGADSLNSKIKKGSFWKPMFGERVTEAKKFSGRSREPSWRTGESGSEQWDEFECGVGSQIGRPPENPLTETSQQDGSQASSEQGLKTKQVVNQRVSNRSSGPSMRQGEGPSARSVWKASKDEETLAAIRGAPHDKPSPGQSDTSSEYKSEFRVDYKGEPKTDHKTITGNKDAGDPFWVLWSRALESVHANDLDGAYLEILGSGDELLLVRMMGHTGPVLQQLASTTVLQLVYTITQLLQQQSFLDCILPWIQQVSDLTASNGAYCLELSEEVKKDLVLSLQDASAMDFAEGWMGNMVEQLFVQLSSLWSIDSSIPE